MSKAIAITRALIAGGAIEEARPKFLERRADLLSSAIVLGCGAALIMAGRAFPF